MPKKFRGHIFDIGANNGVDGIGLAIKNKNHKVLAFEPNPYLCKLIRKLKKRLEKRINIDLSNYTIYNFAISNKNGYGSLNISINDKVSSLNKLSKNIDKSWPQYKEKVFKVIKKISVKKITLYDFMKRKKIHKIDYLHIDTQGHDLNVLKGLKYNIFNIAMGKTEAAITKKKSAYQNNHTVNDIKKFFKSKKLDIKKIIKIDHASENGIINNEADIYFFNKQFKELPIINRKYNERYLSRTFYCKNNLKDDVGDFFLYIFNSLKKLF